MKCGGKSFWAGKDPCWVMMDCSKYVYLKCSAYLDPSKPCWEHEQTQCKVFLGREADCINCKVHRRYGSCGEMVA